MNMILFLLPVALLVGQYAFVPSKPKACEDCDA